MSLLEQIAIRDADNVRTGSVDMYRGLVTPSYTGNHKTPGVFNPVIQPIGSNNSGLQPGSTGNVRKLVTPSLQERYDFSGHGGSKPHLNYDLPGASKDFSAGALGDAHKINLWDK
jgi:hypothetical protein